MNSVDENVEVGLELVATTFKLTGKSLIGIMDLFLQNKDKEKNNPYQDMKTRKGQQKIKDLFEKNDNTNVESLGNNISKDEYKFISKELKGMGVDFAVRKIGKDEYSMFFAGKDSGAIEKGIDNAVKKYSKRQENKNNKSKDKDNKQDKSKDNKQKIKSEDKKTKPNFSVKQIKEKDKELKDNYKSKEKTKNKKQEKSL